MIKLIHAADLHMDSAFEALPPELSKLRRAEQRELLERIAALAESEGAGLILLAGDLLDSGSAYYETARLLGRVFEGCGARVFISPGNHDPYTKSSPYARIAFPGNVHIFTGEELECVPLPELGVRVWGAGFTGWEAPSLLRGFAADKEDGLADIMVIHGDASGRDSPYNAVSAGDIAGSGMDYIALGHSHSYSGLLRAGDTAYAWPGCPEGRGFDETGEKGVIVAEVEEGSASIAFRPVSGRKYEILRIDLGGESDHIAAIEAALPGDCSRDIYRLELAGECAEAPAPEAIERRLGGRFFSLQIRDLTVPAADIWQSSGEDTLRGRFLSRLRRRYDEASSEEERGVIVRALRFGLAALSGMEEPYI